MRVLLLASVFSLVSCAAAAEGDHLGTHSQALSTGLVISQIYGAGGNAGATYSSDFVEIFNRGTSSVSLAGMSVQYASATGTTWTPTALPSTTVPPGGYFLVSLYEGTAGGALPTPDASGTINIGGANGRVALVDGTTALGCGTSCKGSAKVVDFVGYGTATDFEGSAAAAAAGATTNALFRKAGGCTETDDGAADFESAPVAPRNSTSPPAPCGTAPVDAGTVDSGDVDSSAADDSATADDTGSVATDAPSQDDGGTHHATGAGDLPAAPACNCHVGSPVRENCFGVCAVAALGTAFLRRRARRGTLERS